MRELTYEQAGMEAILEEMRREPRSFYLSTDEQKPLTQEFGPARMVTTPITEAAVTGISIGAAASGYRPICDWRMVTFSFVAMDQIVNQVSKIRYMFGGQSTFPITFRAKVGGGGRMAAQHAQSPYSMFMNLAGIKMFLPSSPYDFKGLMTSALRDDNPCISFEANRLLTMKGEVPQESYAIPLGQAAVKRAGSDVTVVALAWMVHEALAAAEILEREGVSVEVIDPRSLVPLDAATICASVQKTGRLVVADEAGPTAGFSAEIAALVTEDPATFARLKASVRRVCALQVPTPYSPVLEDAALPHRGKVVEAIRAVLSEARAPTREPAA